MAQWLKYLDGKVLIEPLWNWNMTQSASKGLALSINRTFMELKHGFHGANMGGLKVLIEPLWNWNLKPLNAAGDIPAY